MEAKRVGLTRKQFVFYARWYAGYTHKQIALEFGTYREQVTQVIARARKRCPNLPMPRRGRRRRESLAATAA